MGNLLQGLGQAQPVSQFVDTALKYQGVQSNAESQRLMQQKTTMEIQQMEKDNAEYHPDAVLSLYPEPYRPYIKDAWTMAGAIGPNGMINGKSVRGTPDIITKYPQVAIGLNTMQSEALDKEAKKLQGLDDPASNARKMEIVKEKTDLLKKIEFLRGKEPVDKAYTLKPGEQRFDEKNQPVASAPKENKVKESFYYVGGDGGEYQVDRLEDGTFVNAGTDIPYDGDYSELKKAGPEKPVSQAHNTVTKLNDPQGRATKGGYLYQFNPETNRYDIPVGEAKQPSAVISGQMASEPLTPSEQKTVDIFVKGIKTGQMAPSQISSFLSSRGTGPIAKIKAAIGNAAIEQGINMVEAESNYKAKSSSFAIQRVQLAKTVMPMADAFAATVAKIPDGLGFVPADDFARKVGRSMNAETLAALEFQKNKMVEEFERMLTGSQMADSRVQRNLDLIKSGYDKKILLWMANEVKNISQISVKASTSNMYPNAGGGNAPPAGGGAPKTAQDLINEINKGRQ